MSTHEHITVDTSSMARALDRVESGVERTADAVHGTTNAVNATSREVSGTTGAVRDMMASVVAAEAAAAQRVSQHVSTGFLGLIRSQLMQKMIEAQTTMQSKCQVLGHYNNMLMRLKDQLEGDYQRISKRYGRIIKQLNENLKTRIYQLDAPAAEVSDAGYKALDKRVLVSGAPMPLFEQDVMSLSNQVGIARCKDNCGKAIAEVRDFVVQLLRLKETMESSIRPVKIKDTIRLSMPVVVMEAEDTNVVGTKKLDLVFGERPEQTAQESRIRANFYEVRNTLRWRTAGSSRDLVLQKIGDLAERSGVDARTRKEMMRLAGASVWQEMEVNG